MTAALLVAVLATSASAASSPQAAAYRAFLADYRDGKELAPPSGGVWKTRFQVFESNMKSIDERNAKGLETHGVNQFTDLTEHEFESTFLGEQGEAEQPSSFLPPDPHWNRRLTSIVTTDHRSLGAVTAVKNQGSCGSCWAFAAVSQVESDHFHANNELIEFSTQQVSACTYGGTMSRNFVPGRDGCNGGRAYQAMQSIADFGGLLTASSLPYRGRGTGCNEAVALRSEVQTQLTSTAFHEIRRDESAMVAQLMQSTLSIALSASGIFQSYTGGVIRSGSGCPCTCTCT